MDELIAALYFNPHWTFIALGGVLLILELLGTGGYSLWSGVSALIVGIVAWLIPLSWPILWILFAILTLITAYIWWLWLKKHDHDKSKKGVLNQPQQDLIGVTTVVVEPIINGRGRVKIKDGSWLAQCNDNLPAGTKVRVIDVEGLVLTVVKTD